VAYLGVLGAWTVLTAVCGRPVREEQAGSDNTAEVAGLSPWRLARQEFLVAATNPKALILFTVFLPRRS
jgi:threonine/homoserine/homoserine lactone efflux protein